MEHPPFAERAQAGETVRCFGYLCPECGQAVTGGKTPFALAASDTLTACSCGGSALRTAFDGLRFHLTVPCGLCGETHRAVCSADRVLRGATALTCAKSGQFCCFIGPEKTVGRRLRELAELAARERDGGDFLDDVILYEVLSELRDIASRPDGITCRCGSKAYGMRVRRSAVDLICRECGARLRIPAATHQDLEDLCCHMSLTIPGGT